MQVLTEVLEHELKTAFEVKDEGAVHRYVSLMLEQSIDKKENETEHAEFREALVKMDAKTDAILLEMHEGFKRMDERFEAVDKRFEAVDKRFEDIISRFDEKFESNDKRFNDMNKRFTMMFAFMSIGFVMIGTLITVFQILG